MVARSTSWPWESSNVATDTEADNGVMVEPKGSNEFPAGGALFSTMFSIFLYSYNDIPFHKYYGNHNFSFRHRLGYPTCPFYDGQCLSSYLTYPCPSYFYRRRVFVIFN